MLSRHEEQNDRLEVLENEKRLRASTLSQFAQSEAAEARGRFTAHEQSTVVGGSAIPKYPAAYLNHDPVPKSQVWATASTRCRARSLLLRTANINTTSSATMATSA
jgi:hypothetical protein